MFRAASSAENDFRVAHTFAAKPAMTGNARSRANSCVESPNLPVDIRVSILAMLLSNAQRISLARRNWRCHVLAEE